MNQSSFIAAFLLAGFVLYLAANNRLSAYTEVLWGSPASQTSGGSAGSSQTSSSTSTGASSQPFTMLGIQPPPGTTTINIDPQVNGFLSGVGDFIGKLGTGGIGAALGGLFGL